ncbi:hypothetical protein FQA39_LY13531 [Lamprigera yunnana]|nr:hypothetical protein FQA39_LY13531 [Lamprigera yunnana]
MKRYLVVIVLKFILAKPTRFDENVPVTRNDYFEKHFNDTFECFKIQLEDRNKSTLVFNESVIIKIDYNFLRVDITLQNLIIDGLTDYKATKIDLDSDFGMDVDITFSKINLSAFYSGRINILGLYSLYGNGYSGIKIYNLNVSSSILHNINPPLIKHLNTVISVSNLNITMTNLMNDEEYSAMFSKFASTVITEFVHIFQKPISDYMNPILKNIINSFIGHFALLDYLSFIASYSCA